MKHLLAFLLCILCALPCTARCEKILFEDENGQVILEDDGGITFRLPDAQEDESLYTVIEETFTPQPSATPAPDPGDRSDTAQPPASLPLPEQTFQYGDSGEYVLAAQHRLTELGYYHGQFSGDYLEGTQAAVRRFQQINGFPVTGKLDIPTWVVLFSKEATASDALQTAPAPTPAPTLAPPPSAAEFTYTRNLQYGDTGDLVSALQQRLLELGFYEARVTGGYYKITRSAVRAFQTHNGLTADGVAGRQTQELLFSGDALPVSAAPRPSPTPQPTRYKLMVDVANQITRAYTYDENGEYTVLVREMICSTGTSQNPTPLGTTIMPKKRARWGYFPTWDSHAQYLTRIDSANAFHSVLYSAADETTLSVESFEKLGSPASHGCVRLYVSDAKWIYDNCSEGTIITVYEGEYDPEYTMTLRRQLNTQTLREGALLSPVWAPAYSRDNWPSEYRTLYRGRSGADVYMLQMRLAELGYYSGTITGGYYGGTIRAVEAFQRDHGLTVDGAAGEKTQSLLFSSAVDPVVSSEDPADTSSPTPEAAHTSTPAPTYTPQPMPTPSPAVPTSPTPFIPRADSVG